MEPGPERTDRVLQVLLPGFRSTLARHHFGDHSCLRSSRIVYDVLGRLEIEREPVVTAVRIVNRDRSYLMETDTGPARPGQYPGHIVLEVERRLLADFSLTQYHRPQRGIILLQPGLFPFAAGGWNERGEAVWSQEDEEFTIGYRKWDCPVNFRLQPGWGKIIFAHQRCVAELVELCRAALGEAP